MKDYLFGLTVPQLLVISFFLLLAFLLGRWSMQRFPEDEDRQRGGLSDYGDGYWEGNE